MSSEPPRPASSLLESYLLFCEIRGQSRQNAELLIRAGFVFPTTLLPLALLSSKLGLPLRATSESVQGYVQTVLSADHPPSGRSYLPAIRLPKDPPLRSDVLARLENLSAKTRLFSNNTNAYDYLLSELVSNIYDHSAAQAAYVMAQYYPTSGVMEVCFLDDGSSIPGTLGRGLGVAYPPEEHHQAILDAIGGMSSKGGSERGYGLPSSIKIITALGGEVLIVSGAGAVVVTPRGVSPYVLRADHRFDGTLVSFRMADSDTRIDFYRLVE